MVFGCTPIIRVLRTRTPVPPDSGDLSNLAQVFFFAQQQKISNYSRQISRKTLFLHVAVIPNKREWTKFSEKVFFYLYWRKPSSGKVSGQSSYKPWLQHSEAVEFCDAW